MIGMAVVTTVAGRHGHLRAQRAGLAASSVPVTHVVVTMGDPEVQPVLGEAPTVTTQLVEMDAASELPLAAARNAGVARAGELGAEVVVLLDVDCVPAPELAADYRDALVRLGRLDAAGPPAVVTGRVQYLPPAPPGGYDLTRLAELGEDHPVRLVPEPGALVDGDPRLLWSVSCAFTVRDFGAIGGFDEDYRGYGGEDTDLGQRLGAAGGRLWWTSSALAWHQHHPVSDPPVEHLDAILRNANLFRAKWGWFPMDGWLADFERLGLASRQGDRWVRRAAPVG